MNNKPLLSYPLFQFASEQADKIAKILNKQKDADLVMKGRMNEFRKIKETFQPHHYDTQTPNIIGVGSIVDYEINGRSWKNVVIDNTSLSINGKTIAISTATPLVKALLGKKTDQTVTYIAGTSREVKITSVNEYSAKRILGLITDAESITTDSTEETVKQKEGVLTTS